ncbi:BAG domain-containing protein starvin isoform X2 [Rhodnius prolixus]|uniref:BAG domain-containing protein n=2 Tax=Rhodnius prolixus TaxID=13249 RepID=T1IAI9_RHOPR
MSFSFRDRPTLRDRLRGKSGDEIMEELKQSLDQDRKKFFESRPNWKQSPASSAFSKGFPFDDDIMPGKSNLQDHLDDIAQRHPEFAQQLRDWPDLDRSEERFEKQREEEEKREEPGPLRSGNLRNTVPDMQSSSQAHDETDRGQRSQSAPPESKHGPGQFVSKVDISGKDDKQNATTSSQESSQQKVFHIPIYVEGRDEPLLPKEATDATILTPKQNRKTSNRIPVHEAQQPKEPPVQKQTVQNQKSAPQATQPPPPPPPPPPPQQAPEQSFVKDPLSQVAAVLKEVTLLKERVDAYNGNSKSDKEYMYLDEMLTRNLLKLDNIDTEGKEEVRTARKEVIKRIQECITKLEMAPATNCAGSESKDSNAKCPSSDPSPTLSDTQQQQQEQMEVPENETST